MVDYYIGRIELIADTVRSNAVGSAVKAFEYLFTEQEALKFKESGYIGEVPSCIRVWADVEELSVQEATDNILYTSARYKELLFAIRDVRLRAHKAIKNSTIDNIEEVFTTYSNMLKSLTV